jgi:hypothetical protein
MAGENQHMEYMNNSFWSFIVELKVNSDGNYVIVV